MKYVLRFAVFAMLLACVPASEKRDPAGAAGFVTEPSAAARGEPFTTEDGWTIRFEKVIVQAVVNASPTSEDGTSYGTGEAYLWGGGERTEIFVRGMQVGPCEVEAHLYRSYISLEHDDYFEYIVNNGVSREDGRRFQRPADGASSDSDGDSPGPSLLLVIRAEKAGRVVTLDVALSSLGWSVDDKRASVVVRADALTVAPLGVEPERILTDQPDGSHLRFDPIANADADADGRVTADELAAAPAIDKADTWEDNRGYVTRHNLFDTLDQRAMSVLVMR